KGRLKDVGASTAVTAGYMGGAVSHALRSLDGDYDLSRHRARERGCEALFQRLQLHGGAGKCRSVFYPDEARVQELTMDVRRPAYNTVIALAVEVPFARRLTTLATSHQKNALDVLRRGRCRLRCTLPQLRLGEGKYLLSVAVFTRDLVVHDVLLNAVQFE